MQDRPSRRTQPNAEQSFSFDPTLAVNMWGACWAGALRVNAQAQAGVGAMGSAWQDFAGRQFKENIAFMQRLGQSRTPDEILATYSEFWSSAADDCSREFSNMIKLATDTTSKVVEAAADETSGLLRPNA